MSAIRESNYWANDPYWTEALDRFSAARDGGERVITLDLDAIDEIIFTDDGPAYRLMEALASVKEHEAYDGYRGAPRLILALLQHLKEQSLAASKALREPQANQ